MGLHPSKAMIATGGELAELARSHVMGLQAEGGVDLDALRERVSSIEQRLHESIVQLLESQRVRLLRGTGRLKGPHEVVVETARGIEELEADFIVVATGSRPRVPEFATVDGERVLTTRQAYPPPELPEHMVVIGFGCHGRRVHRTCSTPLGSKVTLLVSRQQVLPLKDPEVAAALEDEFLRRGVTLLKGARRPASSASATTVVRRTATTAGSWTGRTRVLTVGSIPNSEDLGLDEAGVDDRPRRLHPDRPPLPFERRAHLRRRRRLREAAAVVGRRPCRAARSPST